MRRLMILATVVSASAGGLLVALPAEAAPPKQVQILSSGCPTGTFCYSPAKVGIKPGRTVQWTNSSFGPHDVTRCTVAACGVGKGSGTDTWPASPTIPAGGGTYQFTFTGVGTYNYYCTIHGYSAMHGKVKVNAP